MKIVLLALMGSLLFADFTLIYEMDGGSDGKREEIIQYRDAENARLSFRRKADASKDDLTGEYLIKGTRYSVLRENGRLTYMNMSRIERATEKLSRELNVSRHVEAEKEEQKPFFTFVKKLGSKSVAGIEGEVWEVESQEDGRKYREKIVVTNDRELVEAMKAAIKVLKEFGEGPYGMEMDHDLETMMLVTKEYVLLSAEGMEFKRLDRKRIDDSALTLPKGIEDGMKNLPKMDREKEDASKRILKRLLE